MRRGGTIGSTLAGRIDGDKDRYVDTGEYMGECRAHGVKKKVTRQQLDKFAEAEYERMTSDGWGPYACPNCFQVFAASGACWCSDATGNTLQQPLTREEIILRSVGLW